MAIGTFATVVNCMDGRTQEPVAEWIKQRYGVDYVDTVTEPGPDGIFANGPTALIESIKSRVTISTTAHGSVAVILVGHHDCAGNPVPKEAHLEQVRRGAAVIRSWMLNVPVLGVWVDERWTVELIDEPQERP